MSDRDDKHLKQFKARAAQPKVLAATDSIPSGSSTNVFIVFDQGFGSVSDEIDDTRFRYMGSAAPLSQYETMCGRRTQFGCAESVFKW
jgi:hypothetical protein